MDKLRILRGMVCIVDYFFKYFIVRANDYIAPLIVKLTFKTFLQGVEMGRIVFPAETVREARLLALEKNKSEIFQNNTYKGHPPFHS